MVYTRCIINILKFKSEWPKYKVRTILTTPGLPKGGNSHGNRSSIVPVNAMVNTMRWGRDEAVIYSSVRYYSAGCGTVKIKVVKDLEGLYARSKAKPKAIIDRKLYDLVCNRDALGYRLSALGSRLS